MTQAVFRGTYSDWKPVKTRRVIQIVFEVPWEAHDEAYQALGGMPDPSTERWFGIARIREVPAPSLSGVSSSGEREPVSDPGLATERGRRKFNELTYAQQAGLRCNDAIYRAFLREAWAAKATNADEAAEAIREICQVESRKDIRADTVAEEIWLALEHQFSTWTLKERVGA